MSFFTKDQKIKLIPRTEGSKAGENLLMDIAGTTPNIPQAGVAGLTPMQKIIQQSLPGLMDRISEGGTAAGDYYKGVLGKDFDLESDPRYQTLMQQSGVLTKQASTQARRGSERMGMLDSSPANEFEGSEIQKAQSPILQAIGSLLNQKEAERMNAAQGIGRAGAQEVGNVAAVGGIAETARSVEQQRADALYNQLMQQILFPFQYQASLANSLMNFKPDYAVTGGGMTDLGFMLQVGKDAAAAVATGGVSAGGGGGGATTPSGMGYIPQTKAEQARPGAYGT